MCIGRTKMVKTLSDSSQPERLIRVSADYIRNRKLTEEEEQTI
jgi:hypothetical protein